MRNLMLKEPFVQFWGLNDLVDHSLKTGFKVRSNLKKSETGFELQLAVPGYTKEEIEVKVEGSLLQVSGKKEKTSEKFEWREFETSTFTETFTLPKNVSISGIEASCELGILAIRIPYEKKEKQVNTIKIN